MFLVKAADSCRLEEGNMIRRFAVPDTSLSVQEDMIPRDVAIVADTFLPEAADMIRRLMDIAKDKNCSEAEAVVDTNRLDIAVVDTFLPEVEEAVPDYYIRRWNMVADFRTAVKDRFLPEAEAAFDTYYFLKAALRGIPLAAAAEHIAVVLRFPDLQIRVGLLSLPAEAREEDQIFH